MESSPRVLKNLEAVSEVYETPTPLVDIYDPATTDLPEWTTEQESEVSREDAVGAAVNHLAHLAIALREGGFTLRTTLHALLYADDLTAAEIAGSIDKRVADVSRDLLQLVEVGLVRRTERLDSSDVFRIAGF